MANTSVCLLFLLQSKKKTPQQLSVIKLILAARICWCFLLHIEETSKRKKMKEMNEQHYARTLDSFFLPMFISLHISIRIWKKTKYYLERDKDMERKLEKERKWPHFFCLNLFSLSLSFFLSFLQLL